MALSFRSLLFLVLALCVLEVVPYSSFRDELPNGNNVPHPCKTNYIWRGVGHRNPLGGGDRNQFGIDFKNAGFSRIYRNFIHSYCFRAPERSPLRSHHV